MDRKGKLIKGGRVLDPDLLEIKHITAKDKENTNKENTNKENTNNFNEESIQEIEEDEHFNYDEKSSSCNSNHEEQSNKSNSDNDDSSSSDEDVPHKETYVLKKRTPKFEPMKNKEKITRTLKSIQASDGFKKAAKNTSSEKTTDQSKSIMSKRTRKTRDLYEPNFDPTYKRKEATLFIEHEEDNLLH
jgi:hypothetical protein